MINSYFLPISSNKEFVQARVFDYKRGYTFELMIGDVLRPTFDVCPLSEKRDIIIYVGSDCKDYLSDYFDDFVKVELDDKRDLEAAIRALHIKFPNAGLYVACSKQDTRRLQQKFPLVAFLPDDYCFSR